MKRHELTLLAQSWRQRVAVRELLWALASAGVVGALARVYINAPASRLLGLVAFAGTLLWRMRRSRFWETTERDVVRHWDRTYPAFEESSALLLQDERADSLVEKLQRRRLEAALAATFAPVGPGRTVNPKLPPHVLRRAGLAAAGAAVLYIASVSYTQHRPAPAVLADEVRTTTARDNRPVPPAAPVLSSATLRITPPSYMKREARTSGLDAEVEEGSTVTWNLAFSGPVRAPRLLLGDPARPLALAPAADGHWRAEMPVLASTIYRIAATADDGSDWQAADLHALQLRPDLPPQITFVTPAQTRSEVSAHEPIIVAVQVHDDYGLAAIQLVATVSRGSGEGVKFREQKMSFDEAPVGQVDGKFSKSLDVAALGMEAGDEIYFYILATDNREPVANVARSETRFVSIRGPAAKKAAAGVGVGGVNLVPEYFRSQRQVIIDTEKLVADQPSLTQEDFERRSEQLGIDEKLLRLRYGRFLGEEAEAEQTSRPESKAPIGAPLGDVVKALTRPKATSPQPSPGAAAGGDAPPVEIPHDHAAPAAPRDRLATADEVLAPYVDQHDKADVSTFFDGAQKDSLREVLAAMWDAEGLLRTLHPQEALPAENRALVILKALQESDRAYVQRVGFEARPVNIEARRLRGELDAIPAQATSKIAALSVDSNIEAVRLALARMAPDGTSRTLVANDIAAFKAAEPVLTLAATRDPGKYLQALGILQSAEAQGRLEASDTTTLAARLYELLPPAAARPERGFDPSPELARAFAQEKSDQPK